MGRLLRLKDYDRAIQSDNLDQIVSSNYNLLIDVEQAAQLTMTGHLSQRYKVAEIFNGISTYNSAVIYYGKNLVEYTEAAFSASSSYVSGDRVVQNSKIYSANTTITPAAFNVAQWTLICDDKLLFYITLPYPEYLNDTIYDVDTFVWFENKVYKNKIKCTGIIPSNLAYWTFDSNHSVTNTLPTDTTKWTQGDNRNQEIVQYLLDITLYNLHCRINPRNVPDLRKERFDGNEPQQRGGAIGWLKNVSAGKIFASLPEINPEQGLSINWGNANGNNIATVNTY
jgi:hypothetical protein